jgi:5-methylcytosine-specific restriction protein A
MALRTFAPKVRALNTAKLKLPPKQAERIYSTPEYKAWRERVIKRARGRCQGTGCGRTGGRLFADHIVELKDGGAPFDDSNGQALCGSCHTAKTAMARAARR